MTTEQMDGLHTPEDVANQYTVWLQCRRCAKWTKGDKRRSKPCEHCGADSYDPTSMTSERSFNPVNKRRVKAA